MIFLPRQMAVSPPTADSTLLLRCRTLISWLVWILTLRGLQADEELRQWRSQRNLTRFVELVARSPYHTASVQGLAAVVRFLFPSVSSLSRKLRPSFPSRDFSQVLISL